MAGSRRTTLPSLPYDVPQPQADLPRTPLLLRDWMNTPHIRWRWLPRTALARGWRQAAASDRAGPSQTSVRPPCRPPCGRSRCSRRPLACWSAGCPGTRRGGCLGRPRAPRPCPPPGEDVLHREPKVGERLHEGAAELRPGLQVKGAWESRGMGDVAWRQDVHFGLRRVGIVERFDPPSNHGPVLVYF